VGIVEQHYRFLYIVNDIFHSPVQSRL
jgi:hypothetical protein